MNIKSSVARFMLKRRLLLGIVFGILIMIMGTWLLLYPPRPDSETYQAVFLTNGQAYFGRLTFYGLSYARLDEVHYLVANPQSNDTTEAERSRKSQLIKLGSEVHAPLPYMFIPKRQILFWEDLRADSQIVKAMSGR